MARPMSTGTKRPGGRAAVVVSAVHEAAAQLLVEVGYDGFELTDVATRAGVHKTTVYRRWPTKADLVSDLLLARSEHEQAEGDRGSLLADLLALLTDVSGLLTDPLSQALLRAGLAGAIDPAARRNFWDERMRRSAVIVDRAIARGELPPGTDARALLEHAASPIYFRHLITGDPVTPTDVEAFARRAIAGAAIEN